MINLDLHCSILSAVFIDLYGSLIVINCVSVVFKMALSCKIEEQLDRFTADVKGLRLSCI